MTQKEFNIAVQKQIDHSLKVLIAKGTEYAPDVDVEAPVGDRLAHFKRAAGLQEVTMEQAAFGMLSKHLASVAEMCEKPEDFTPDRWQEKLTDSINYMLILSAIVGRARTTEQLSFLDETGAVAQEYVARETPTRGALSI